MSFFVKYGVPQWKGHGIFLVKLLVIFFFYYDKFFVVIFIYIIVSPKPKGLGFLPKIPKGTLDLRRNLRGQNIDTLCPVICKSPGVQQFASRLVSSDFQIPCCLAIFKLPGAQWFVWTFFHYLSSFLLWDICFSFKLYTPILVILISTWVFTLVLGWSHFLC